jgi:hypothetical protein
MRATASPNQSGDPGKGVHRLKNKGSLDHDRADPVRIDVGGGTTIFEVSLALDITRSRNSDRSATICNDAQNGREESDHCAHGKQPLDLASLHSPETPAVNVVALAVSCFPVRRFSLSSPYTSMCCKCLLESFSMYSWMALIPPSALVSLVE